MASKDPIEPNQDDTQARLAFAGSRLPPKTRLEFLLKRFSALISTRNKRGRGFAKVELTLFLDNEHILEFPVSILSLKNGGASQRPTLLGEPCHYARAENGQFVLSPVLWSGQDVEKRAEILLNLFGLAWRKTMSDILGPQEQPSSPVHWKVSGDFEAASLSFFDYDEASRPTLVGKVNFTGPEDSPWIRDLHESYGRIWCL
ncbi:hypothetical protein P152DRAFT_454879 [Eremomyces bilateralis CBS 781.70]|uniref:Uncharacterized protein n=1 Tax=Eremomyces bilateralis CBS 781.70 TaxID=1392243 RepID=A0A6G1GEV6_9PEZI|nr:uncharacterized protein P152DRAFT_454879 [Eremomyces bilateralis CBS 781.70]KAF1816645.1 hypothetical protein P152DRAFT_454879 [Eremomyces bilateralis CBS 781.70]